MASAVIHRLRSCEVFFPFLLNTFLSHGASAFNHKYGYRMVNRTFAKISLEGQFSFEYLPVRQDLPHLPDKPCEKLK